MKRVLIALSSLGLTLTMAAPVSAAGYKIVINGNGYMSVNRVRVESTVRERVEQTNSTVITNNITQNGNSGGNSVDRNVGAVEGNSQFGITTGNVDMGIDVENTGGTNIDEDYCDCAEGQDGEAMVDVAVEGNGAEAETKAKLTLDDTDVTDQDNSTVTTTNETQDGNSGDNSNDRNTGGDATISSGTQMLRTTIRNYGDLNQRVRGRLPASE